MKLSSLLAIPVTITFLRLSPSFGFTNLQRYVPYFSRHHLSSATNMANTGDSTSKDNMITILGFGSLLSERSSRMTFPELENFRLARVPNYRRVFGHATSLFFKRGIANMETKEMASLSAEPDEGNKGFVCAVFEVDGKDMMHDGVPSEAFLMREEEFDICTAPFIDLTTGKESTGVLCARGSDELFLKRWGQEYFEKEFGQYGLKTIWNWGPDSGLKPCGVYLRHCTLAAEAMGEECYRSFLDETFLVDRQTTLRTYLAENPQVMETVPPPELEIRYGG